MPPPPLLGIRALFLLARPPRTCRNTSPGHRAVCHSPRLQADMRSLWKENRPKASLSSGSPEDR